MLMFAPSSPFSSSSLDLMESNMDRSTFSSVNPPSVKMFWYADFRESKVGLRRVFNWFIVWEIEKAAVSPLS